MPDFPPQITDGNGATWKPAASPGRHGEPVYCDAAGPDNWASPPPKSVTSS